MAVSSLQAAKRLCERSGWSLTNLGLQKIIYISHMLHMGETNGDHLVTNYFEAWDYGPVSHSLYRHVRAFGSEPVGNVFRGVPSILNAEACQRLDEVYDAVKGWTAGQLVAFTHRKGGAWDQCYDPGQKNIVIPDEAILDEYKRFHA